jgi:hypothetical protein
MEEENEKKYLDRLALRVLIYLVTFSVVALFAGYALLGRGDRLTMAVAIALMGISGSGVAALTSCLNRYANGFELENGKRVPDQAVGETFNRRMALWFIFRPFLGLIVAPVFVWGIETRYISSSDKLGFWGFVGGLLAKSVIDLIKGLFKSIFKV